MKDTPHVKFYHKFGEHNWYLRLSNEKNIHTIDESNDKLIVTMQSIELIYFQYSIVFPMELNTFHVEVTIFNLDGYANARKLQYIIKIDIMQTLNIKILAKKLKRLLNQLLITLQFAHRSSTIARNNQLAIL